MPNQLTIESEQWDRLRQQLAGLTEDLQSQILIEAATDVGVYLDSVARTTYPPKPRKLPQAQNWTEAQRRFWWWVMNELAKNGGVDLPATIRQRFAGYRAAYRVVEGRKVIDIQGAYMRTNALVRSLSYDVAKRPDGVLLDYGTNIDYAPLVIGDENEQAAYHRGNWVRLIDLLNEHVDQVTTIFEVSVAQQIERYLGDNQDG